MAEPDVLGPRLAALRNDLRERSWKSIDDELLLAELDALEHTVWIVSPASAAGGDVGATKGSKDKRTLEIRVSSGGGDQVFRCSTCPYAGA